jgi:hypothetical protein
MRAIIIAILFCLGAWIASPGPAQCNNVWCPTYTCYGAGTCGINCQCMSQDSSGGVCVSIQ